MASKSRIRRLVAETMAELGYGRGMYGWRRHGRRVVLEILTPSRKTMLPLPSGMSLRAVRETLSCVPRAGERHPLDPTWGGFLPAVAFRGAIQLDIEAAL